MQISLRLRLAICLLAASLINVSAHAGSAAPRRELYAESYGRHLRGMWLAQSIANWTGLQTEGTKIESPFLTDADWGSVVDFVFYEPWPADDDTDVEYILLHLMTEYDTT